MKHIKRILASFLTCIIVFLMIPASVSLAATNGWVKYGGEWYYYSNGVKQRGRFIGDNGKYYYLDPADGHMWRDDLICDANDFPVYYVGKDGLVQYNKWILFDQVDGYDTWFYAGSDAVLYTGWHKMGGKWYYFCKQSEGVWCPFAANSMSRCIDGTWYVFNKDCSLAKNKWVKEASTAESAKWEGGEIDYFYADSKGHAAIGWKKISKKWYYFDVKNECIMVRGFKNIDGKRYYFANSGALKTTGWFNLGTKSNPKWYFAMTSGEIMRGWWQIGSKFYYFDKSSGLMARNKWVGDKYLADDGHCTNW